MRNRRRRRRPSGARAEGPTRNEEILSTFPTLHAARLTRPTACRNPRLFFSYYSSFFFLPSSLLFSCVSSASSEPGRHPRPSTHRQLYNHPTETIPTHPLRSHLPRSSRTLFNQHLYHLRRREYLLRVNRLLHYTLVLFIFIFLSSLSLSLSLFFFPNPL